MAEPDLPEPLPDPERGPRLSWVWLMPLIAIAISGWAVWRTYADQGPLIVVTFPAASGMEAGQTPLRFRDVTVGMVETLEFSDGLAAVEAHIRIEPEIAPYVDADAAFWLVEPEVTARGVSGLGTVLSGVFIEGSWDSVIGEDATRFTALEGSPLSRPGEAGTRVVLRTRQGGQLSAGAPVLFNGLEVGRLGVPQLSDTGSAVTTEAFIAAPHDARLSTTTKFWDISGISVDLGAAGLSINFESLASLIEGGVSFGTLVTGGQPVDSGHVYDVFPSQTAAREAAFDQPVGQVLDLAVLLPADDLRLAEGAAVRFGGLRVGEVTDITGYVDDATPDAQVQILVGFTLAPDRIGLAGPADRDALLAALDARVRGGLRVRVAGEGLLGTTLILEMLEDDSAAQAGLTLDRVEAPLMPSLPANVPDASASIDAIATRVANLPIEDLMAAAIDALDSVTALAGGPDMRALPGNVNGLVAEARAVVAAQEVGATLQSVSAAAADLQALTARITASDGLDTALGALEGSDRIMADLQAFTAGLPDVLAQVDGFVADLRAAPVADVAASADRVLQRTEAILAADGAQDLPASLNSALSALSSTLQDLRAGGATDSLVGALGSADSAFAAIEQAAGQVPALVTRLDGLVTSLQGVARGYSADAPLYGEVRGAIRDISEAADAFRALARAIERNPNSLLRGR